jgi:hypothetical protein
MELSVPVALFPREELSGSLLFVAQSYRKRFRIDFLGRALTHTIIISAFEEYDGLRGIISAGSSFNCTFMKSS